MRYASSLFVAATMAVAALPAHALQQPQRKAGLWEVTATSNKGEKAMVMQQCTDAAFEAEMQKKALDVSKGMCSKNDMRQEGGKIFSDSVCKVGATTVTSQSVTTGDFSSAYRVEVKSTYNPPMAGTQGSNSVMEARWVGPCLPGQKPGDMVMPGMKVPKTK